MHEIKEQLKAILADDEVFDLGAQMFKKAYDSLVKAGFASDEALTILARQGVKGLLGQ